jgi:phage-related holin
MHYTLTPRGNAALMALMAMVLLSCFLFGEGPSLFILVVFVLVGAFAGLLQNIVLRRYSSQFQSANTALQVRAVFVSSVPGKISVVLLWVVGLALILMLFYGGQYATIQTVVGSYAVFSLVREGVAFQALFLLRA